MLNAVEFQAKIQNGIIQIPDEYKQELGEGDDIKVIVLVTKKSSKKRDIIDELTENPVQVDGVFSRLELARSEGFSPQMRTKVLTTNL